MNFSQIGKTTELIADRSSRSMLVKLFGFVLIVFAGLSFCTTVATSVAPSSFQFQLVNGSKVYSDSSIYWTVVGQNRAGKYCYLNTSGELIPMAMADNDTIVGTANNCNGSNEFANYSYQLSEQKNVVILDTTLINSAILYISIDGFLPICVQKNADSVITYAPPSFENPSLQGYDMIFQAVEFAYNITGDSTLNINTTNVDEVGLAIDVNLKTATDSSKVGFVHDRLALIDTFANCVDTNFRHLIIPSANGTDTLRILSPEHVNAGMGIDTVVVSYFEDFYTDYIDSCWNFYSGDSLTILVSGASFTGQWTNDTLFFNPGTEVDSIATFYFTKPTSSEVISANGQFIAGSTDQQDVGKFISAAMFRTVFMEKPTSTTNSWCSSTMKSNYFTNPPINYYGKILHENSIGGLCYAYGYSDVCGESSSLASNVTTAVVITIKD